MGAGCRYTHAGTDHKASWICLPGFDEDKEAKSAAELGEEPRDEDTYTGDMMMFFEDDMHNVMAEASYTSDERDPYKWHTDGHTVRFESTYNGDGYILYVNIVWQDDDGFDSVMEGMIIAEIEHPLLKKFHKELGYEIRVGSDTPFLSCLVEFKEDAE